MVLSYLTRFSAAQTAIQSARTLAARTFAPAPHQAMVAFAHAVLCETMDNHEQATHYLEFAIRVFDTHGAEDRAYKAREYDAFRRVWRGQFAHGLAAYQDAARRARDLRCMEDLGRAYSNIGHCYRGLGDLVGAQRYFRGAARVYRCSGLPALEAKALRCVARTAIRIHGEASTPEMEKARDVFLGLGAAGEVCRCTVAIMEELVLRDPRADVRVHIVALEEEAAALGVLSRVSSEITLLEKAASTGEVDTQILDAAWDAFGPTSGLPAMSAVETVLN